MRKILFMGGLRAGGAEHQMVVVARLLKEKGYDVTYLCDDDCNFYQNYLESANIPLFRLTPSRISSFLRLNTPYLSYKAGRIFRKGQYDTIISFLGFSNFINCLFANQRNLTHRAITGIRNNRDEVWLSWRDKFYTYFEKNAYRKVSNSDVARVKFSKYFPKLSDKIITIYNIVDLPTINSTYTARRDGKIHIIVPASYRAVKNPMAMLRAVAQMKEETRNLIQIEWYGSIHGGKACYDEMTIFIKENNLSKTIKLYDATTDIANRINEADVVGLFSTSEGLPNSVCEGMMLGKPIVMTRVSDYDVLAGKDNGFLCDASSIESIAEALTAVSELTDEQLRIKGELSKVKAKKLFSKEAVLKKWEAII